MQGNDTFREAKAAVGAPPHIGSESKLHPKRGRAAFGSSADDLFSLMGHATRPSGPTTVSATPVTGDLPGPRRLRGGGSLRRPATTSLLDQPTDVNTTEIRSQTFDLTVEPAVAQRSSGTATALRPEGDE
jgi:hypothetical protein